MGSDCLVTSFWFSKTRKTQSVWFTVFFFVLEKHIEDIIINSHNKNSF